MSLIAKAGGSGTGGGRSSRAGKGPYQPAPAGPQLAVCCDVIDLGKEENKFKPGTLQHKIRVRWLSQHLMADGRPFLIQKKYTLSLHPKAELSKDLESWRGAPFTDADRDAGFDIEKLLGKNCFLNVVHTTRGPNTYADVMTVMRAPKGLATLTVPADYVRVKDQPAETPAATSAPPADDEATAFNPAEYDQRVPADDDGFATDTEF
jgi:hypothetical protein